MKKIEENKQDLTAIIKMLNEVNKKHTCEAWRVHWAFEHECLEIYANDGFHMLAADSITELLNKKGLTWYFCNTLHNDAYYITIRVL